MLATRKILGICLCICVIFMHMDNLQSQPVDHCHFQILEIEDQCLSDRNATIHLPLFVKSNTPLANKNMQAVIVNSQQQVVWSGSQTTNQFGHWMMSASFIPTLSGTYQFRIYCKPDQFISQDFKINLGPQYFATVQQTTCYDSQDGQIILTPSRGEQLTYEWQDGGYSESRDNLAPGRYTVTATNQFGCTRTEQFFIRKKEPLQINLKTALYECFGQVDSLAVLEITGGREPYKVDWSDDGMGDYDDNVRVNSMPAGRFDLAVKDADGCEIQVEVRIEYQSKQELKSKSVVLDPLFRDNGLFVYDLSLTLDHGYGDIDNDGEDGSLFEVSYYEDEKEADQGVNPMSRMYNSDKAKTIYARVENEQGCFVISQIQLADIDFCLRQSEACDNDPLLLLEPTECDVASTPLPGNGTYEIFRKEGGDLIPAPELLSCDAMNNQCFIDPTNASGNYEVFYTYMKAGVSSMRRAFFDIQEVNPQVNLELDLVCFNGPVFDIRANPVGGTLSGPGIIGSLISGSNQFFYVDPSLLDAGDWNVFRYTYSQFNFSGLICTKTTPDSVFVSDFISAEIAGSNFQSCYDSEINLQAINFRGPISRVEWHDPDGVVIGTSPLVNFVLKKGGTYSVHVFNSDGCTNSDSVNIEKLDLPEIVCDINASISCPLGMNAMASVTLPGITDFTGYTVEWSNGATGFEQDNLGEGEYVITVTAPNGCIDSCIVDIVAPDIMEIECNHVLKPVTCFGGDDGVDSLFVTGGTPPYMYSRDNITYQSSPIFQNVNGGMNRFYIRDANDCLDSCDFHMPEPSEFFCTAEAVGSISCQGQSDGRISIMPIGGIPPYTYLWSNGATTREINNLDAGTYTVTTMDSLGCACSNSFTLIDPPMLTVQVMNDTVSCFGGMDGQLAATVNGGTPPFTYVWSNGGRTSSINGLSSGSYSVEVTDVNGCMAMANAEVIDPLVLDLTCDDDLLECFGDQDGQLTVAVEGGTMPYTYQWSNGQTSASADQLPAGTHRVIVTDANGCQDSCFGTISQPLPLTIDIERDSVCLDFKNEITAKVNGGIGNYTYTWSIADDGGTGATAVNLENPNDPVLSFNSFCLMPGTVDLLLTVEDLNGCIATQNVPFLLYCCFDLAVLKTVEKSSDYVPGEVAEFDIEVFNQGEVDAFNIVVADSLQAGMTLLESENTAKLTGNAYDWLPTLTGTFETRIDFIPAGSSQKLKVFVNIDDDFEGYELINYTEIVFYSNGIKDNPIDEDDFQPGLHPRLERNNDVADDRNGSRDNPSDEDKKDFEPIFLCSDQPFACNDHVQVTLDENGEAVITPDMLGEGLVSPAFIEITIKDENKNVQGDTLNCSHIGLELEYSIYNICTDVTCWGNLSIEDKMPPVVSCARPDTLFCHENPIPFRPDTVTDNCGVWREEIVSDEMIKFPCDSAFSGKRIVTRNYVDAYGNVSESCIYVIYFERYNANDVVWPNDTLIMCENFVDADPQNVGVPKVNGVAIYPMDQSCSLAIKFKDDTLNSCGSTFKIIRRWTALDWCPVTGVDNPFFHIQVIKTVDLDGPVVYCPGTDVQVDTFSSDANCQGTFLLPEPHRLNPGQPIIDSNAIYVISECSDFSYDVRHVPANDPTDCTPSNVPANKDQIRRLPNGRFEAFDLPYGCNWFYYTIEDECGHQTECTFDIFVKDMMPPVAVCDQHTVVSLNLSGLAELPAISIDDGSQDNCAIDTMLVRRMDGAPCGGATNLRDRVIFCCQDIGQSIMVEFVVVDESGNSNSCMVEVLVQNKTVPVVDFCPADITIDCQEDYRDTTITGGQARFEGVCPVVVSFQDFPNLNDCGVGAVRRIWSANDSLGGQSSTCTQIITLRDFDPITDARIAWPDTVVEIQSSCDLTADPDITGRPRVLATGCHDELMTFSDQILSHGVGSCIKILRTWTVVDWCTFDLATGAGEWTFEQTIIISNVVAPILTCSDTTIAVLDDQCGADVLIEGRGSDDCTPTEDLEWAIQIDLFDDGNIDHSSLNSSFSQLMPLGTHRVIYLLKDGCGNDAQCEEVWTVVDRKLPSPVCKSGLITVVMAGTGQVTVWASDLNEKSFDNCTDTSDLLLSFSSDPMDDRVTFDCSDIKNGISDTIDVELWVTDASGNQDRCMTTIILQDNANDVCPDQVTSNIIQGKIQSTMGVELMDVEVTCKHISTGIENTTESDANGAFDFRNVQSGQELTFSSFKTNDWLEGVTTKDLILIQQHLLGLKPFSYGYQYMAGDVNNDQSVSASDIVTLRKLILGRIEELPGGQTSWRFVDGDFIFDMLDPFVVREQVDMTSGSDKVVNFTGIKIGDINDSYNRLSGNQTRSVRHIPMYWIRSEKGWTLHVAEEVEMIGYQLGFYTNGDAKVHSNKMDLSDNHVFQNEDLIKISWNRPESIGLTKGEILMEILTSDKEEPVLDSSFDPVIYDQYLEEWKPMIVQAQEEQAFDLYQNIPNPFDHSTTIPFHLNVASQIELMVFNSDGVKIHEINGYYSQGDHEILLQSNIFNRSGVMYYRMKAKEQIEIRKMIRL